MEQSHSREDFGLKWQLGSNEMHGASVPYAQALVCLQQSCLTRNGGNVAQHAKARAPVLTADPRHRGVWQRFLEPGILCGASKLMGAMGKQDTTERKWML